MKQRKTPDIPTAPASVAAATPAQRIETEWRAIKASADDMKRHALQLGAVLIEVEGDLAGTKAGRGSGGLGLKGWIEENLSEEIRASYISLMRWKKAAHALMTQARLEPREAIALLTDDGTVEVPTPSARKCAEVLESKTLTQLVFDFGQERKAAGRKPGQNPGSYKDLRKSPAENARFAWAKVLVAAKDAALSELACLLPQPDAAEALARLEPLVAALRRRVAER